MSFLYSETLGGIPTDLQAISPMRALAKWNHNLRGVEIIQLGNTYPGMEVHCIEDYLDIFVTGHTYIRSSDNARWLDTTQKIHTHAADTDAEGGLFRKVLGANMGDYVFNDFDPMRENHWARYFLGGDGGDVYNTEDSVVLDTLATAGNYAQLVNGGNRVSFEDEIYWYFKYELMTDNSRNSSFRAGVGCERVWEVSNIRRMFGVEWCDDNGEDRTYMLFSADGSERNAVITSKSANNDNDNIHAFSVYMVPQTVLRLTFDGTDIIMTKGNNIPRSLATGSVYKLLFGFKTMENVAKQYRIRTCRFVGKLSPLAAW